MVEPNADVVAPLHDGLIHLQDRGYVSEHAVPRMTTLAKARADGRAGEAEDLRGYAARSTAGKRARN